MRSSMLPPFSRQIWSDCDRLLKAVIYNPREATPGKLNSFIIFIDVYICSWSKTTVIKPRLINRQITNQNRFLKKAKNIQCGYIRDL